MDNPVIASASALGSLIAVELALLLDNEKKLLPAAMMLCNELQTRLSAGRAALSWVSGGNVRLLAISNMREFEKGSELAARIQSAMEECALQDEEITHPLLAGSRFVMAREHAKLAAEGKHDAVVSIPLRWKDTVVAVITVERSHTEFTAEEVLALRLLADLSVRRLRELKQQSEFFVFPIFRAVRNQLSHLFGLEWLGLKLFAVAVVLVVTALFLIQWPYRVEATFTLRTETMAHVTAPFDGFIAAVHARTGDVVQSGDLLLELDTRELVLQRMEAELRIQSLESEIRLHQSSGRLADAGLARVKMQEETARLSLVDFRLQNARMLSPQSGIIVEGELLERIGAVIGRGDVLFRLTRVEDLYLRLDVNERDVHEIGVGATGEFAFASAPERRLPFVIESIQPAAVAAAGSNLIQVRGRIEGDPELWWRPGMSGVAKIDVERRPLIWIITHRLIDYIRMKLWI